MDNASIVLGIIGALMTLISVTIAIFTFYFNRKKETGSDGEWKGELRSDLKHIKDGVDELKTDNEEIKGSVADLRERVALVEASAKSAHHRIDSLEIDRRETHHVN